MGSRKLIFTLYERLWHWIQAISIIILILTGTHLHYPEILPLFSSMKLASTIHHIFGYIVTINFIIWIFYMISTGRIIQYKPRKGEIPKGLFIQAKYYLFEIYTKKKHPYHITPENRLNPLQRVTYLNVMFFILPIQILTGIFMFFGIGDTKINLIVHGLLALFFLLFLIGHIYLGTTGDKPLSLFKEMITGYQEEEE